MKKYLSTIIMLILCMTINAWPTKKHLPAQAQDEYTFNDEPDTVFKLDFVADTALYIHTEEQDGFYIQFIVGEKYSVLFKLFSKQDQLPTGNFPINSTQQENTILASVGGAGWYIDTYSFVIVSDSDGYYDYPLYIVSGNVSLSKDNNDIFTAEVNATTAKGSTIHLTYQGTIYEDDNTNDATYDYEPDQVTQVNLNPIEANYLIVGENEGLLINFYQDFEFSAGILLINNASVVPTGTFPINFTGENNTIVASIGGYSAYDEYSYVSQNSKKDSLYLCSYYLVEGSMTISKDKDGNYIVSMNATSAKGSTITLNYNGPIEMMGSEDRFTYNAEPDTPINLDLTADSYYIEKIYGGYIVELYAGDYFAKIKVMTQDGEDDIKNGAYAFADTYEAGTACASKGGNNEIDDYSFVWKLNEGYVEKSYFITQGQFTINKDKEGEYIFDLDATSAKGSTFKITYNTNHNALQQVESSDLVRIENSTIIVKAQKGEEIQLFDLTGKKLFSQKAQGETKIDLTNNQIVILQVGNRIAKIAL